MKKAGRLLQQNWNGSFLHITCLAHLWHRVAENIRSQFEGANLLIANMNKVIFRLFDPFFPSGLQFAISLESP